MSLYKFMFWNSSANNQDIHVPKKSTNIEQPIWRSNRNIIKPVRFRDENFIINEKEMEDSLSTDSRSEKVKRILAKKKHGNSFLYLVQLVGEPSQNAQWRSISHLLATQVSPAIIINRVKRHTLKVQDLLAIQLSPIAWQTKFWWYLYRQVWWLTI
jgi:hypothetical protein